MVIQKYYFNIKQNYGVNLLCLLLVISTNLELVKSVNCVLEPWFIQDDSFANLWNTQGRVNGYDGVENRLHCSAKCQRLDACVSFFYNPKTSKCQVNSVIYLSKAGQVTTVGATYFRKYKECPAPPSVPPHSERQFDVNTAPTTVGTVLNYTCSVGYGQEGSVTCQVDGTWSGMSCIRVCPAPPSVTNASPDFDVNTCPTTVGTVLKYTCSVGYIQEGSVTCLEDGTWSEMSCIRVCPAPPSVTNASPDFDVNTAPTTVGTDLQYTCNAGYIPEGSVTCQVDGTWSGMSCIRVCPYLPSVTNASPDFDVNTCPTTAGTVLKYTCSVGYIQEGSVTCLEDGTWSVMSCIRVCPAPPSVTNASPDFDANTAPTTVGTDLKYTCSAGYIPEGSVTCLEDGTWSVMSCIRVCPYPPSVPHSERQFDVNTAPTTVGTVLNYTCSAGYGQEGNVTCLENYTWSVMSCIKVCPAPPSVPHSERHFDVNTAPVGTVLNYTCIARYIQEGNVTCLENYTWSVMSCIRVVRSCSELKTCNSIYSDGEYWINPEPFGTARLKTYCHNLRSSTPLSYLTLNRANFGYNPKCSNRKCDELLCPGASGGGGDTNYDRIRFDPKTMKVDRIDRNYASTSFGSPIDYGTAKDKYAEHEDMTKRDCGPQGHFQIDTSKTGVIFDPQMTFDMVGNNMWSDIVRSNNDTTISVSCGGWPGSCEPHGDMILRIAPSGSPVPAEDTAIIPRCV